MGFPMGIPIWDGNGNHFKPMGIPTRGFCGFSCEILWVFPQKSCGNGMGMGIEIPFPRQPWFICKKHLKVDGSYPPEITKTWLR